MFVNIMKIIRSKPTMDVTRVRIEPDLPEWDDDRDSGNLHAFLVSETGRKTMSVLDHTLFRSAFSYQPQTEMDRGVRLGFASVLNMLRSMGDANLPDDEGNIL